MNILRATSHDNRGDDAYAYGFVYFSDGLRVAYTQTVGVVSDATGGWGSISPTHTRLAKELLKREGILK